jgi:hypothetical protein
MAACPKVIVEQHKSEPFANRKNLSFMVRIMCVWCEKQDLNLHVLANTRT